MWASSSNWQNFSFQIYILFVNWIMLRACPNCIIVWKLCFFKENCNRILHHRIMTSIPQTEEASRTLITRGTSSMFQIDYHFELINMVHCLSLYPFALLILYGDSSLLCFMYYLEDFLMSSIRKLSFQNKSFKCIYRGGIRYLSPASHWETFTAKFLFEIIFY